MAEEKFNTRRFLITVGIVFIAALAVGGATWWGMDQGCIADETNTENVKVATAVPNDFKKITVGDLDVNVPNAWGDFKTSQLSATTEDAPWFQFDGYQATADKQGNVMINISNYPRNYGGSTDQTELKNLETASLKTLNETYDNRAINTEEVLSLDWAQMMPINAKVSPYNPRYIENNNGSWRGFWAVANIGQDFNNEPQAAAIMYNKSTKQALTIMFGKNGTTDSKKLWAEIEKNVNLENGVDYNSFSYQVDEYLRSAYFTDSEVKDFIDNEFLIVLKTL